MQHSTRIVKLGDIQIGGPEIPVIAGPCAIESFDQFFNSIQGVYQAGASAMRGGIYKMRTNPQSFQGLGQQAYPIIETVKSDFNMPLVSEVTDPRQIELMMPHVDMFQVGSRNMYNYALLRELALTKKPILLKRGFSATIDEWIQAANYILQGGNDQVVLCERGIRGFETKTRNTLDLNAVAYIKQHTNFAIVVDPSHGTGRPELMLQMSGAAIAAGADALMLEVHVKPAEALSDAAQALSLGQFEQIMNSCRRVAKAVDRYIAEPRKLALQKSKTHFNNQEISL